MNRCLPQVLALKQCLTGGLLRILNNLGLTTAKLASVVVDQLKFYAKKSKKKDQLGAEKRTNVFQLECGRCGHPKHCQPSECLAGDKTYRDCNKRGHFKKLCQLRHWQRPENEKDGGERLGCLLTIDDREQCAAPRKKDERVEWEDWNPADDHCQGDMCRSNKEK